jgi:HD-GYP domain-containing protein (c-di-GMP phosphodiesterase class II)
MEDALATRPVVRPATALPGAPLGSPAAATTGLPGGLQLAELLGAFSHALDLTEGQPAGHCIRACWIGQQLGAALGLPILQMRELYYAVLLKDLGCSSNAARICQLYLTDDLQFKRDFKTVGDSLPQVLKFVVSHTGLQAGLAERFRAVVNIFQNGGDISRDLMETRCTRGAEIARQLRFSEAVSAGIQGLDEHWNGGGKPYGLAGDQIPLYSRIALMAQVIDVFFTASGPEAALGEVRRRRGRWFDPALTDAFLSLAKNADFWRRLSADELEADLFAMEPAMQTQVVDDDYLDDIATAFGQVVDAKSPYTSGHSGRVALYTDQIARTLGLPPDRRRWLKRAALLHDVGKLGVSNTILDKPGKLDAAEWQAVRQHAAYTEAILGRIHSFKSLATIAGAHHERLDGGGYPRGVGAHEIPLETRIITTADIFDAITAERPYRGAVPIPKTLAIMRESVGTAIDANCFEALVQCSALHGA